MLASRGIGIPDRAIGPYCHPRRIEQASAVAWSVEHGLGDEVAWAAICGDVSTVTVDDKGREVLHLAATLAAYRAVHGNQKGKRR